MVPFQYSLCLLSGSVRSRTGFGKAERAELFALRERYEIFLLLFFVAELLNGV